MKTGIFYGTTAGTTAKVANRIANAMHIASSDVYNIAKTEPSKVGEYDFLIFGSPTYGSGELQDDWYDFLDGIAVMDLRGKRVAIFGLGDENMRSTFCNAAGIIYKRIKDTGAEIVGHYNTFPYQFESSEAVPVEGAGSIGLLIDEVNHPEATDERIAQWTQAIAR